MVLNTKGGRDLRALLLHQVGLSNCALWLIQKQNDGRADYRHEQTVQVAPGHSGKNAKGRTN